MRKKLILGLLLAAMTAGAVKMKPGVTLVKQSDGTSISVRAYGDEDLSYFLASDGTLLCQQGTDFFVANVTADGRLVPSQQLAHEPQMRGVAEATMAKQQNRNLFFNSIGRQASANRIMREPVSTDETLFPHSGQPHVAVILVEFSDVKFSVSDPKATFDKYLNAEELFTKDNAPDMGYTTTSGSFICNYGSVSRYFNDMSFGQFKPKFDVYGPVTLAQPMKYYGEGSSSQENMKGLFTDACSAVDADVDFSQYDINEDGNIDLVYIIYAGFSQSIVGNPTDCIHPKSGLVSLNSTFDGKSVRRYGVSSELNGTTTEQQKYGLMINGIGVFCHEFSHCMGLPDLYPSGGTAAERAINQNMEYWSLMDSGEYTRNGYCPTAYTAWEREAMGWMSIETLNDAADISLSPVAEGGKAYRVVNDNDASGNEYFIVENIRQSGWNSRLYSQGMMVTHVDYDENAFSLGGAKVNSVLGHPRMTVVAADGLFIPEYFLGETVTEDTNADVKAINAAFVSKYGGETFTSALYKAEAAGDLFPGSSNVVSLTDDSNPAKYPLYSGSAISKPITDIAYNQETGVVSFKFKGGKTDGISDVQADMDKDQRVFSVSGLYVGKGINSLSKGIYIVNGKKIVKG